MPLHHTNGSTTGLTITAQWEKPLVPTTGGTATLLVRIAAPARETGSATRRAPVDVAFVLDHSGSMAGEKLALVKEAVHLAVSHLSDTDGAALVVYDDTVETLQRLEPATARVKTSIRLGLQGVDEGGLTHLSGGWLAGCQELSQTPPAPDQTRIRRALLLTDGLANVGILDPARLAHHAGELRKRGVTTTTLGVGQDFDELLLSSMAEAGGGGFQYIAQPADLPAFFERELGELLNIAAANVTLSLTLPAGARGYLLNAFPTERKGKRIDIALRDLTAGDEITLLIDCRVRPDTAGATRELLLEAGWTDPAADARRTQQVPVPPLHSADLRTIEETPANPAVTERAVLERAARARREAVRLDRAGDALAARASLRETALMLQAAPQTDAVRADLTEVTRLAAAVIWDEDTHKRTVHAAHRRSRHGE